jgi:ribosome-associated protein
MMDRAANRLPPAGELQVEFFRAAGPGGQNVNKVSTAVRLRYDVAHSAWLPEGVRARLLRLAGRRATREGVIILEGRRFRTQQANRDDVEDRLARMIAAARRPPRRRKATKPTAASRRRRLDAKRKLSRTKRLRSKPGDLD